MILLWPKDSHKHMTNGRPLHLWSYNSFASWSRWTLSLVLWCPSLSIISAPVQLATWSMIAYLFTSVKETFLSDTGEYVNKIPCHNCKSVYIGKTGRSHGKRLEGHRKDTEIVSRKVHRRTERKASLTEVTDNHQLDWSRNNGQGMASLDKTSENPSGSGNRRVVWTEMQGPMICYMFMTIFWSWEYCHVTTCLMKFSDANEMSHINR